jgi:hypothetical protein
MKRNLFVYALIFCTIFQLKAQWTGTNPIYTTNLGASVGIGTSTPSQKLHIYGGSLLVGSGASPNTNSGIKILAPINSTNFNWLVGANSALTNGFEITPSTTAGGTTFSIPAITITNSGNVGIGRNDPGTYYKLNVWGPIRAHEVVVNITGADFVFAPDYKLPSISEIETFIKQNNHLPDISPASEMQKNGIGIGELQTKLLQKLEELTLYIIDLDKKNESQSEEIEALKHEIDGLKGGSE